MRNYYVYIFANKNNNVFYTGVTGRLIRRAYEHKNGLVEGFSRRYRVKKLLYYETYTDVRDALEREKKLKKWRHDWKARLIRNFNPSWRDLSEELGVDMSGAFAPY